MSEIITVPDIGDFSDVDVVEVLISAGDKVNKDDSLISLESDKASLDVPSPISGVVIEVMVKVTDKVSQGTPICTLASTDSTSDTSPEEPAKSEKVQDPIKEAATTPPPLPSPTEKPAKIPSASKPSTQSQAIPTQPSVGSKAHASPSVRRVARILGVNLEQVTPTGPKGRVLKEDVEGFVRSRLAANSAQSGGTGLPAPPAIDFNKFGATEIVQLSKVRRMTGSRTHMSWLNAPQVTQFDRADITELEVFRKSVSGTEATGGTRLSILPFVVRACASALAVFPEFNSSIDETGERLILKKYINIGVAVDTPNGLMVPVIRNADNLKAVKIAEELIELSSRARAGKSKLDDFQGASFTISSLGGIGGTAFTPIVNVPEVAIIGVSKAEWQPIFLDGQFVPRLMLPLSLSYDHRVIDGAVAARFTTYLSKVLSDIRHLLL